MTRELLGRYKQNRRELSLIDRQLVRLKGRMAEVDTVSGKVSKTSDDWPYIEEHMTVKMAEPRAATAIKDKIREKKDRRKKIQGEILQVEKFIKGLPEGIERQIFEMVYLEEMSQRDAADMTGYTQSMVSKIIKGAVKDS